jgi:hypothetical protein
MPHPWKDGGVVFEDPQVGYEYWQYGCGAVGSNTAGTVVGGCDDYGYVIQNGVATLLDIRLPNGAPGYTYLEGVNDAGTIYGTACDTDSPCYGLLIRGGVQYFYQYPGAVITIVTVVNPANGKLYGSYMNPDGSWHSFIATRK